MIRLEPLPWRPGLETLRARHRPRVEEKVAAGEDLVESDFPVFPVEVKVELEAHQRNKCAWCERDFGVGDLTVEHFRPKMGGFPLEAWSGDNLLAACGACQLRRGSRFPMEEGRPLWIHPGQTEPADHLEFKKVDGRWTVDHRGTAEGRYTVEALALERRMGEVYRLQALEIEEGCGDLRLALDGGDELGARRLWARKLRVWDDPRSRLRALGRAVLGEQFADALADGRLEMPPEPLCTPGLVLTKEESQRKGLLDALPQAVADCVYRLGGAADADAVRELIGVWEHFAGWAEADLCCLFDRSPLVVRRWTALARE